MTLKITKKLKNFLEQPEIQQLLAKCDFDTVYKKCPSSRCATLTAFLLDCGLQPLNYLTAIPTNFLRPSAPLQLWIFPTT